MTSPFLLLAIGLVIVIGGIVWLRVHAFLALALAAFVVGALTPTDNRLKNAFRDRRLSCPKQCLRAWSGCRAARPEKEKGAIPGRLAHGRQAIER